MTLMSEITRVSNNIAAAYVALDEKGATLPETQNSANLADTISTISTGGGSSDTSADQVVFDEMVSAIQSVTWSDAIYNSSSNSGNITTYLLGIAFKDLRSMYIKKSLMYGIFASSGSAIDTSFVNNDWVKLDFSNSSANNWVILASSANTMYSYGLTFQLDYTNLNQVDIQKFMTGIALQNNTSSSMSLAMYDSLHIANSSITRCYISDKFTFSDTASYSKSVLGAYLKFDKKYWDIIFPKLTNFTSDTEISSSDLGLYATWGQPTASLIYVKDFPFVLSMQVESIPASLYVLSGLNTFHIKVKIRNNKDFTWKNATSLTQTDSSVPVILDDYSLEYLATNAPTITESHTITLHTKNTLSSYWSTFASTMQGKGWTVTTGS